MHTRTLLYYPALHSKKGDRMSRDRLGCEEGRGPGWTLERHLLSPEFNRATRTAFAP
ncbi:hypothetical protein M407DRAFT_244833 [Tulasnella calospora MUT 4182]|uniref:Uncharacterized protein n=1 Tax=Tulasnella calospora MUT 4182 TaxID=1051891 RepID=A0A0C3Q3K9_9AGAM|nr:hypothetical protein M407DRAFT_244833 [Tulasnella calospora MUT 4182]